MKKIDVFKREEGRIRYGTTNKLQPLRKRDIVS